MKPKIPKFDSSYIPVGSYGHGVKHGVGWWRESDSFHYDKLLINLETVNKETIKQLEIPDDMFLLTDSGGFQAIRGNTDLNWETSLIRQIELNATKIFAFDKPPVKRMSDDQNVFTALGAQEFNNVIKDNIDVAIKQSNYLQDNYPESKKRFCYVIQGVSLDSIQYNIEELERKIGMDNYDKYFPGGVAYSVKTEDLLLYALTAKHANDYFISKGRYVHFLGMGSFNKMLVLIRNKITTFDSSNALRGAINWMTYNPTNSNEWFGMSKANYPFTKNFCYCPACNDVDFNDLLVNDDKILGPKLINHNVWTILKTNAFLDALRLDKYTELTNEFFKINAKVNQSLEAIDYADKNGLNYAYEKYKHNLKVDKSKQNSLF